MKNLKSKIWLIIIGLIFLIAFIGITSLMNLFKLEMLVDDLMTDNYKSISAIHNMIEALERQDDAIKIYMETDRQSGIVLFEKNRELFDKWYNIEINNITELGEKEIVEKIGVNYEQYLVSFGRFQEMKNSTDNTNINKYYDNSIMPLFNELKQGLKLVISLNEKSMFSDKEMVSQTSKKSVYFVLSASVFAVIGGFIVSWYFTRRFLKPLSILKEGIKKVKENELGQYIEIETNDEIALLSKEFNEMTERLKTYEQSNLGNLLMEKNKSLAIVKSISDPLLVLDGNYRVILINKAAEDFFVFEESKVLNKHFLEIVHDGEIFDHISSIENEQNEHIEKIIKFKKEKEYYFNIIVSAVKDSYSKTTGLIVLMQNVTELKTLELIKTDFMATISHEFKTPLTSILMGTSMLLEGKIGQLNIDQTEVLKALWEDGEKLSGLVTEILELSRIESTSSVYHFVKCDIDSILKYSLSQFSEVFRKKEISIILNLTQQMTSFDGDYEKISWVINNLISNAIKFSKSGDTITLISYLEANKIYISIKDTGEGISEEFIDKIFDRYFHYESEIQIKGTGLGLAVAKDIIKAHNGEIWVESVLGEGSAFTFFIPIKNQEAKSEKVCG